MLRTLGQHASHRRNLGRLAATLAVTACASVPTLAATKTAPANPSKPNIIFILADDLGYGDLGCYGSTKIRTPVLDQMAKEGARFTQFYAGAPLCSPSRASLMTGLDTGHVTIRGNKDVPTFSPQETLVPEVLKRAGYATGLFGKWGVGGPNSPGAPLKRGYDEFFGVFDNTEAHSQFPLRLYENEGKPVPLPENANLARKTFQNDLFTQHALNFVDRNQKKPFFIELCYTIPHASLTVPADSLQPYLGQFPETPFDFHTSPQATPGVPYAEQANPHAAYAAMISRMDQQIGDIVARLKVLGLDQNTLIVFTSDNGPHREGGGDPAFFNSSGSLRGIKRDLYEGGIRVPMIARWTGHIKPIVSDLLCYGPDMMPTFAQAAGAAPPAVTDGFSLLPTLTGGTQLQHLYLYWETYEPQWGTSAPNFWQAARQNNWKAVRHGITGAVELYDMKTDSGEKTDVAATHPEVVAKMMEILKDARSESKDYTPH